MTKLRAVCFDLFFTLIVPAYDSKDNENDVLYMSTEEWERYAEAEALYRERAVGAERDEECIISKITDQVAFPVSSAQKKEILERRKCRMRRAMTHVDEKIVSALGRLRETGVKLCLISNADAIDCMFWQECPLSGYFDEVLFSCDVGILKPDLEIYQEALRRLECEPEETLFVGDGGSQELKGAKNAGMITVFTEYLDRKEGGKREEISRWADYQIDDFEELPAVLFGAGRLLPERK